MSCCGTKCFKVTTMFLYIQYLVHTYPSYILHYAYFQRFSLMEFNLDCFLLLCNGYIVDLNCETGNYHQLHPMHLHIVEYIRCRMLQSLSNKKTIIGCKYCIAYEPQYFTRCSSYCFNSQKAIQPLQICS